MFRALSVQGSGFTALVAQSFSWHPCFKAASARRGSIPSRLLGVTRMPTVCSLSPNPYISPRTGVVIWLSRPTMDSRVVIWNSFSHPENKNETAYSFGDLGSGIMISEFRI